MKDYSNYNVTDFVLDDQFLPWLKKPAHFEINNVWQSWIVNYPEMVQEVEDTKNIIFAINILEEDFKTYPTSDITWTKLKIAIDNCESYY